MLNYQRVLHPMMGLSIGSKGRRVTAKTSTSHHRPGADRGCVREPGGAIAGLHTLVELALEITLIGVAA